VGVFTKPKLLEIKTSPPLRSPPVGRAEGGTKYWGGFCTSDLKNSNRKVVRYLGHLSSRVIPRIRDCIKSYKYVVGRTFTPPLFTNHRIVVLYTDLHNLNRKVIRDLEHLSSRVIPRIRDCIESYKYMMLVALSLPHYSLITASPFHCGTAKIFN